MFRKSFCGTIQLFFQFLFASHPFASLFFLFFFLQEQWKERQNALADLVVQQGLSLQEQLSQRCQCPLCTVKVYETRQDRNNCELCLGELCVCRVSVSSLCAWSLVHWKLLFSAVSFRCVWHTRECLWQTERQGKLSMLLTVHLHTHKSQKCAIYF